MAFHTNQFRPFAYRSSPSGGIEHVDAGKLLHLIGGIPGTGSIASGTEKIEAVQVITNVGGFAE